MATDLQQLLIDQWRDAPRLNAIVRDVLAPVRSEVLAATGRLDLMANLDEAEGIWLDLIGLRLGLGRPSTSDPAQDRRFGFDQAGEPFDSFPFRGIAANDAIYPIADAPYRALLRARGILMLGDGTTATFIRAIRELDPDAAVVDNRDMTISVTTGQLTFLELANQIGALPRSAGVTVTFVAA